MPRMSLRNNLSSFQEEEGTVFRIMVGENQDIAATLIEVKALETKDAGEPQPFSLLFETEQNNEYYSQGTFVADHPRMGRFELFLVPMGPGRESGLMCYEAVFN